MTNDNQHKLELLLNNVTALLDKETQISKLKQESFNIFSILRKDHEEVKLHSAFIAELLNSQGAHEQGNKFCNLFVKQCGITNFETTKDITVVKEKNISELGRIDIYIENNCNHIIAIENKIYAADQDKQLERYHAFLKKDSNSDYTLIYLTLFGKEASDKSIGEGDDITYKTMSYQIDILAWLDKCLEISVDYPTLRETIKQYITLVKKLTNQLSKETELEVNELIAKNYESAKYIADNIWKTENDLTVKFLNNIEKNLSSKFNTEKWIIEINTNLTEKWCGGITIRNKNWPRHSDKWPFKLCFLGHPKIPWSSSIIGFSNLENCKQLHVRLQPHIKKLEDNGSGKFDSSNHWGYYQFVLETPEERKRIFTEPQTLSNEISKKIITIVEECNSELVEIAKECN